MKKFMIHCSTTKSYWITVEAPNKVAVTRWYDNSCAEQFLSGEEWGWEFQDIEELQPTIIPCDIVVDSSGEQIDDK